MFEVGQNVICNNVNGVQFIQVGSTYKVTYVSPAGLAIKVEGSDIRFQSSRFDAVILNTDPVGDNPECDDENFASDYDYDVQQFFECCGIGEIYFENASHLFKPNVQIMVNSQTYGMFLCVLNKSQHTERNVQILQDCGFSLLSVSKATGGDESGNLYMYNRLQIPPVPE